MDSQLENPLSLSKETSAPEQFPFNKGYLSLPKSNDCSDDQKDRFLSNSFISEMGPKNSLHGSAQFKLNKGYSQESDISNNLGNIKMGEKSLTHSSDTPSEEPKFDEMRGLHKKSRPGLLAKKSEEIRRSNSMEEQKEPNSASSIPTKDENASSFVSEGGTVKKPTTKEYKKSSFVTKNPFTSKPAEKVSLTFDAFVDKFRGETPESIPSTYPSYKIDKRLKFVGKTVEYPWHVISYNSTFRKLWNFFIVIVIILQIFWYPTAAIFIYEQPWPSSVLILEKLSILVFMADIIINLRTTFTNENNEEIIDGRMMRRNYITNKLFIVDVLTTLPIPEILLATFDKNTSEGWAVFSISILVRMLRCFKVTVYLQDRIMSIFFKLSRVFITFFIVAHWVACIWYLILKLEFPAEPDVNNMWFPNNLRMVARGDQDLLFYYFGMDTIKVYGYTLLSVFMLMVGSDMAPLTNVQIWCSVFIGLFGQVALAYIFGLVTVTINRANEESMSHEQKLEELKHKIKVNQIPHNLRVKIMEFFNYSWRKHNVLKKTDDFSELSVPLQRDIALYQHQDMIIKVPLFQELEPIEVLSIVQKLKTSIYMPGDRIIREGEKGNEMFFIQEGLVEMMIKRVGLHRNKDQVGKWITQFERMILEQGDYFGEVALVSNSKRTFEARAYEFCILYAFSKNEYENLNNEFKNIGPRLRSGLRHYKNTRMKHVVHILKNIDIFRDFVDKELIIIGDKYLEEVFVDPEKLVLTPRNKINALYIILSGNVNCYRDNEKTRKYLTHLKKSQNKDNWTVVDKNDLEDFDCIDDDILDMEKDKLSMEDQKKKLDLSEIFTYGEYFGALDFGVNETKCNEFYLSDSGCQILALTEALKLKMEAEHPKLYEKLRANLIDLGPKKVMMPIEEEEDSSFTTKNNTKAKGPSSRRQSIFSDMSKRAPFVRSPSLNKEEDVNLKEELQKIRQELHNFKSLVSGLNLKLGSQNPKLKSREVSPSNAKRRSFTPMQISSQLNAMYKWSSVKELANGLLGVDEEDQGDETKT